MNKSAGHTFLSRVRVLTLLCIVVAITIIGRLYYLQILRGHAYIERANAQFLEPADPLIDRGSIYFTDKDGTEITAATIKEGFALAVNPIKVDDPEALCAAIKDIAPLTHDECVAKATKPDTQYQQLAQHLDTATGAALEARAIPGLIIENDRWRVYPGESLAAQEIGFVAYHGDVQEGRYGLEQFYNTILTRHDDGLYSNFFVELFGAAQSALAGASTQQGDIVTTIEPTVQAELERQLAIYDQTWHPQLAGGIIMNPQDGEIYAMAISPTFDLNSFNTQTDPLIYANPLVQSVYEMGSIIKPLTMAAGIDSGAITATTTYDDMGCITVDTKSICNFDSKARGVIPMQQILSQSLNVGASFIATRMGGATMRDYFLNHYGFATTTGIDEPGEIKAITNNLQSKRQVEYDTASFGQGIALTPVETARALAVLANGGYLVTPHLVSRVHLDNGLTQTFDWDSKKVQVLKPDTALTVSRMLTEVVDTTLAGGVDKLDHYSVAAKTGTAQIADPVNGGYYSDRFLHSFFGYFPSYDATYLVFLFAYEPVGAPYAAQTLAPPWHSLTQFLINYYHVPPDR